MVYPNLRILVLNDFACITGGADAGAIASTAALHRAGVDAVFFGGAGMPDGALRGVPTVAPDLAHVHCKRSSLGKLALGLWNREAESAVRSFVARHAKPGRTVVHVQSFTKVLSPSTLAFVKKTGLPTVLTAHDYFCFCPNGNYFNFQQQAPCTLEPLSAKCGLSRCDSVGAAVKCVRLARASVMKVTKTYGASFDATIAVSGLSAGVLRSFSPNTPESVVRYLLPEPRSVARSNSIGVVYVGRLTRSKGVVALARASRKAQVAVTFVGEGEARDEVVAENPDAVVTGWVTPKATEAHILGATALVLPSLWYETFGLVVAEALSLGRPVVVSDRAGAKELVQDGVNGLIWRSSSEDHLVECLRKVARASYAAALSERVPELYRKSWVSPERHAAQLMEVYQRAWSARGQASELFGR